MTYSLDTNVCIRYLNGRSENIFQRLSKIPESDIYICSVVRFELRHGALRSNNVEKTLAEQEKFLSRYQSLPFDDNVMIYAANIRAELSKTGNLIGPYDLLIGAIALANNLVLVTHNVNEFSRIAELQIEDSEVQ